MTLSDVADFATVGIGALAIYMSVRVARATTRMQALQIEQDQYNELTEVLLDINRMLPTLHLRPERWAEEAATLKFLAYRADHLLGRIEGTRINYHECLQVAHAFAFTGTFDRAEQYFSKAEKALDPKDLYGQSEIAIIRCRWYFGRNLLEPARSRYMELIADVEKWRDGKGDDATELLASILVNWANDENNVGNGLSREQLLSRAENVANTLELPWRKKRAMSSVEALRKTVAAQVESNVEQATVHDQSQTSLTASPAQISETTGANSEAPSTPAPSTRANRVRRSSGQAEIP